MQLHNSPQAYGSISKVLHWATVLLVVAAWLLGTFGDDIPRGLARSAGLFTHISAGLAIISLLLARILWRVMDPAPPFELTPLGIWSRSAAKLTHFVLYALLAATPIVGVLVQF